MEQHPIPQNVTAYQFRLVGDMTLKQFLELASGCGLAFLITRFTLLPVFFRWPLAAVFAFLGVGLAFLPVEERPLDQWLRNFVKSIYSPTQFLWKKSEALPGFFTFTRSKQPPPQAQPPVKDQAQLKAFVKSFPSVPASPLDQQELTNLKKINQLLGTSSPPAALPFSPQPSLRASLGIKTRPLRTPGQIKREEKIVFRQVPAIPQDPAKPAPAPQAPVVVKVSPPQRPLKVASLYPERPEPEPKPKPRPKPKPKPVKKRVDPVFAQDLPLPAPPEAPNLITGMVVSFDNRLLPNTIIEVRNQLNQVVRAVKTNKLGQFFIATPLLNGSYELMVEHLEESFDIIRFKAQGKIIPPISIKARKKNLKEAGGLENQPQKG